MPSSTSASQNGKTDSAVQPVSAEMQTESHRQADGSPTFRRIRREVTRFAGLLVARLAHLLAARRSAVAAPSRAAPRKGR